jgi:hypothetical protein
MMNAINRAVKQYQQNAPAAQPKLMADCISHIAGHLPNGIILQIDNTGVSASMGTERFTLHPNRYELQSDIEALYRLAARRINTQ